MHELTFLVTTNTNHQDSHSTDKLQIVFRFKKWLRYVVIRTNWVLYLTQLSTFVGNKYFCTVLWLLDWLSEWYVQGPVFQTVPVCLHFVSNKNFKKENN